MMMATMVARAMINADIAIRGDSLSSRGSVVGLGMMMMLTSAITPVFFKNSIVGDVGDSASGGRGRQAGSVNGMMTRVIMLNASAADGGLFAAEPPARKTGHLDWAICAADA